MFCPNCGTKAEEGALFCGACGTNLQNSFVPVEEVPTQETPVQETPVQETPVQEAPVQNGAVNMQPQYNQDTYEQPQYNKTQYNQAQYNQPQYNQNSNMQQMQPRAPFKPNKFLIASIIEAVVAIIAIVIFINVGKSTYGYKNVAKTYFEAVCCADWDTAYKMLDVNESTFINKDMFVVAMSNMAGTEINQSKIKSVASDDMMAYVTMQYSTKSGNSIDDMKISLNKQKSKNFLFFDSWKVSPSEYVIKNCVIKVPKGATLTMDEITVPEEMKTSEDGYDVYTIPYLFKGQHKFQISIGDLKGNVSSRDITYDDDSFYFDSIVLSENQQKEVIDSAFAAMTKIVENATVGGTFNSIKNLYIEEAQSDAEYNYTNYFEKRFFKVDGEYGITNVSMTNVKGSFEDIYIDEGKVKVRVKISYSNVNNGKRYDYWDKKYIKCVDDDNLEEDSLYLQYEDGQWLFSNGSSMPYGVSGNSYFYK